MHKKVEEMRKSMIEAAAYSKADIEEVCKLEEQYIDECNDIARECEREGLPSRGSDYELRCEQARKYYDEQIKYIICTDAKF